MSTVVLLGAIGMSFLPWLELRSSGRSGKPMVISQSGIQVAMGNMSVPAALEAEIEGKKRPEGDALQKVNCPSCGQILEVPGDAPNWMPSRCPKCGELFNPTQAAPVPLTPLVAVFLSLIISAVVSSLIIRSVYGRALVVGALSVGGLAILIVQTVQGFPLERVLGSGEHSAEHWMFKMHYTPWFWCTFGTIVLALAFIGLEYLHVRDLRTRMMGGRGV
jgi:hypothetical protein